LARTPPKRDDTTPDLDRVRAKTVVTSINRIAEHAPTKEACLVVIYGPDLGRKHNLESPSITLGRSNKCDIQIDQESVSRAHSKIVNAGRSVRIRDLGSTNGTYVNDELVEERTLADGDFIKIGRTIFKFLSGGNIERAYHEEIYRLTTVDGLTQIFNKRYFSEALAREIARATRYRRELSLVMFDLDHFKEVNDTHGHLAGDAVLKTLSLTVKAKIRTEDIFARYGGEEFAIILPEIDGHNAHQFAEKIRRIVETTEFRFESTKIPVTISMGVATLDPEEPTPAALIRRSDERLYEAKSAGRNCVMG
jgi:diguanylate cyclase (GGDEF)-like protein